ncbi:MFS transporter [Streptomyces tropicalis]|uniref:MFS transporter n=1 Tax=Streptomyces tropicalis TaxID=3034234 RepID=A0ABT5ZXC4_9ACTN|nr:MFS transporter [Streptomyces tropicalis]MDF3297056.1 MFS transporter [Streptomyces tropicalis]
MTATSLHPAPAGERPAHRDPNVLRWLGAYTSSAMGDSVWFLALSWAAVQAGTPAEAGFVTAAGALPRALLMLGGGVVADRYGPRRVVLGSSAVRCALVLAAALLLLATRPGLWTLGAAAVVFGVVDAVFLPAAGALPARIAAPSQLARVQGMRGLATRLATVLGGPVGGLGVAVGGTAGAFGLAALLIGGSLPVLLTLRGAEPPPAGLVRRPGVLADLCDGFRRIAGSPVLRVLIAVIALSDLGFVGPMNLGLTLLAQQRGWGSAGMGWVLAGFGAGAGAASLLVAVRGRVPRPGLVLALAEAAGAVAIAGLARVPSVAGATCVAALIGLLAGLGGALAGALVQVAAGPAHVGRVTSVSTLAGFGVAPLTFPLVGAAVERWGTGPVFTACATLCAAGAALALSSGALRRAELPG